MTSVEAVAAGLRNDDLITAINGRTREICRMRAWANLYVIGQAYKLTLERGVTITITAVQ